MFLTLNCLRFRNIEKESLQDLAGLLSASKHGNPIPKYHYEKRRYQIVNCNVDLTDNECELAIIRAINLPIPSGMDAKSLQTYAKFEFPYPPVSFLVSFLLF
jgi:coiled-coil and C2 domain-containing protein 1